MNHSVFNKSNGVLYLIPVPLTKDGINYLPPIAVQKAISLKYYFVEKLTTARRFLKAMDKTVDIDSITFSETGKNRETDIVLLKKWLEEGKEVGVMSEAGMPCVADPGNILVAEAHRLKAKVVPYPGPNSMLLALVASGFNGQAYRFAGYLPIQQSERNKTLKAMEKRAAQFNETQIFMETPFRNNQLLKNILEVCHAQTLLGIACNLNSESEFVQTKTIAEWKSGIPDLHKKPTVFTLFSK